MRWHKQSGAPSRAYGILHCFRLPAELPRIEAIEFPSSPAAREIRVIAGGLWDQLPSGYRTQAEDAEKLAVGVGNGPG